MIFEVRAPKIRFSTSNCLIFHLNFVNSIIFWNFDEILVLLKINKALVDGRTVSISLFTQILIMTASLKDFLENLKENSPLLP